MATGWGSSEAGKLAARWQYGASAATLPGSCPHCHHNGAFTGVSVPAQVNLGLGDRDVGLQEGLPGEMSTSYPRRWAVTCECGDASHGDENGCGRSGLVQLLRGRA